MDSCKAGKGKINGTDTRLAKAEMPQLRAGFSTERKHDGQYSKKKQQDNSGNTDSVRLFCRKNGTFFGKLILDEKRIILVK